MYEIEILIKNRDLWFEIIIYYNKYIYYSKSKATIQSNTVKLLTRCPEKIIFSINVKSCIVIN